VVQQFELGTVSLCSDLSVIYKTFVVGKIYVLALYTTDPTKFSVPGCSEYAARVNGDFLYRFEYSNGEYFEVPFVSMDHYREQLYFNKEYRQ
jgi:hypothetical protein